MNTSLTQNHFELFGLPLSFEIDQQKLASDYRELQSAVHPDRFANASDQERRISVQKAAQINEAFQTLKSPIRRARYLLELKGVEFDDQRETAIDPTFLMEQMELREALGEIGNDANALASLGKLLDDIQQRTRQLVDEINPLLQGDAEAALTQAKSIVHKLQFMQKLQQEAEAKEEDLANLL
ncbi:MAG: Fe-S protein assembly co-chaperone HscB [Gammaproteobacteria bacterium]|nr:Fe-S protein assembly co-chaperone HscB [Gammaproteobacteria bacterium]MDH5777057.1 Fe-S protein assembly co-chaperone HscB [Gammaproteobacteria bacterium]